MENLKKVIGRELRLRYSPKGEKPFVRSFKITDVRPNGKDTLFVGEQPYEMSCFSFAESQRLVNGKRIKIVREKQGGETTISVSIV